MTHVYIVITPTDDQGYYIDSVHQSESTAHEALKKAIKRIAQANGLDIDDIKHLQWQVQEWEVKP